MLQMKRKRGNVGTTTIKVIDTCTHALGFGFLLCLRRSNLTSHLLIRMFIKSFKCFYRAHIYAQNSLQHIFTAPFKPMEHYKYLVLQKKTKKKSIHLELIHIDKLVGDLPLHLLLLVKRGRSCAHFHFK